MLSPLATATRTKLVLAFVPYCRNQIIKSCLASYRATWSQQNDRPSGGSRMFDFSGNVWAGFWYFRFSTPFAEKAANQFPVYRMAPALETATLGSHTSPVMFLVASGPSGVSLILTAGGASGSGDASGATGSTA